MSVASSNGSGPFAVTRLPQRHCRPPGDRHFLQATVGREGEPFTVGRKTGKFAPSVSRIGTALQLPKRPAEELCHPGPRCGVNKRRAVWRNGDTLSSPSLREYAGVRQRDYEPPNGWGWSRGTQRPGSDGAKRNRGSCDGGRTPPERHPRWDGPLADRRPNRVEGAFQRQPYIPDVTNTLARPPFPDSDPDRLKVQAEDRSATCPTRRQLGSHQPT